MRRKEFMKRVLTGCLTGALVLSSPLSFLSGGAAAHAKEIYTGDFNLVASFETGELKTELAYVTKQVKKKIDLPKRAVNFSYDVTTDENGDNTWYLSWSDKEDCTVVEVTCDKEARIESVYWNVENRTDRRFHYSKEQLAKICKKEIAKMNPEMKGNLRVTDDSWYDYGSDEYYFEFERVKNDVPVYGSNVSASINTSTGKITSFSADWDYDLVLPSLKGIKTKKEAKKILKEELEMELVYQLRYVTEDDRTRIKAELVYVPANSEMSVDAKTGKVYDESVLYRLSDWDIKDDAEAEDGMLNDSTTDAGGGLTPQEQEEIDLLDGLLSKEEASKLVLSKAELYHMDGMTLTGGTLYRESSLDEKETEYYWTLQYSLKEDNESYYSYANVNAETGEIINYYISCPEKNRSVFDAKTDMKAAYTQEECQKLAEDYLKKYYPEFAKKTRSTGVVYEWFYPYYPLYGYGKAGFTEPASKEALTYTFSFDRLENGILCPENYIRIGVSAVNGKVYEIQRNWTEQVAFESAKSIISEKEAENTYLASEQFTLIYGAPESGEGNTARLVYSAELINPANIRARDGKWLNDIGEEIKKEKKADYRYDDIKKSKHRSSIEFLANMNIGFTGKQFHPEKKITKQELFELCAQAGIYFDMEEPWEVKSPYVSHMDGAKIAGEILGMDEILQHGQLFRLRCKDQKKISRADAGYAAYAAFIGLYTDGKDATTSFFYPNQRLTRGEAASMICVLMEQQQNCWK